jgi:tetratricopeptide (TPR) repeat protein
MKIFNITREYLENLDFIDNESIQESINYLNQVISIDPLYVNAYIILAQAQIWGEGSNIKNAIDNYTRAIELDPNNSWAYYWRAEAFEY